MATAFEQWQAKQSGSAPKAELTAFQKWELEQKKKKEQADAAKATAAPAPASSAGVLSALERQRRLAEGIPLDPVAPDNPLATAEASPSDWAGVAEGLGRTASRIPGAFNRRSADVLSAGAKALLFPAASLVDAVSGGTASRDALGNVIIDPLEEIVKSGAPTQGADVYDQLGEAGGQLGLDLMAAVATGGQSTLPAATTRMAPYLAKIAEQTARQSVVPSFTTGSRTAQNVMEAGGSPEEAVLAGLAEGVANTASNILPSNIAGGLASRTLQSAGSNIAADAAANAAVNPFLPDSLKRDVLNPEQAAVSALVGGGMGAVLGPRAPAANGAAVAREKLQNAGAYADSSKPPPIVPPVGGATTPPATTQKAPVARSAKPQKVSDEASLAAAVRLAADLKADPTLGVPEADRPKTLIERKAAYEAIEQRKAEAAAIEKKLPSIVKGVAKAATVQSDSPFDVTGSTNRIIGNLTKSIPAETPVQSLVRTAQAQTRREVQAPATVEAPAPVATPTPVAETPLAQAGRVIDERRSALEQASRQDRLDDGTVKKLQREEEELRLTLQEDERRKAAGVLQTPEVPYLSEREITSISEKRGELRDQLERHRAAVGYGNQLADLDTSLSKLGDSDNEVIALATKLQTPTQPKAATAPLSPSAPVANQVPNVQALPLKEASNTTIEATKALEEPIRVTQPEQQGQASVSDTTRQRVTSASSLADRYLGDTADDVRAQALLDFTGQPYHNIKAEQLIGEDQEGWNNFLADAYLAKVEQVRPLMDAREQKQNLKDTASFMERSDAEEDRLTAALPNKQTAPKVQTVVSGTETPAANDAPVAATDNDSTFTQAERARERILSTATNATEALAAVRSDAFAATPAMRGLAEKLSQVDLTDVRFEVVTDADTAAAKLTRKDGGLADGRHTTGDNTSRMLSVDLGRNVQSAEVVIHEVAHGATAAVLGGIKAGRIKDPELVDMAADVDVAVAAVQKAIADKTLVDDSGRADYSVTSADELLATVFASPTLRKKLDELKIAIPRRGPRRGRVATALQVVKDFIRKALRLTPQEVEMVLVTQAADKTVTRFAKEKSAREIGRNVPSKATDMAPDVSRETPLSKGKGIKARLTNALPVPIKKAALARGTASQETADMIGSMRGMGNLINHTLASDLQALQDVGAKELGKRLFAAEGTQNALVKYFSGDTAVSLPTGIKKAVDKIRAGVDSLSFKLAALGVLTPEKLGALVANFGKYVHRSYKAWDMKPGEWADLVRSSRGVEAKTVAEEMFTKVKDEMLEWIAIPDNAELDALYAKATDKDNADGARAAITKLNTLLFNHVPAIDRQDKSSAATVKEQIDALKKARDDYAADPNKAVENAERLMQKLLDPRSVDLNDDRTSNFYKLFAVDAGATKTRQEVPNWLQTVWGKNEEFDAVAIATVHAITDMVAKHSKINEYKERLIAAGVVRTPEQGGAFGYSKLDSGNRLMDYGSLEGHYIKDEDRPIIEVLGAKGAADAAALFFGGETANAVWAAVEDVAATTKIMGVTLNFSSMMVNAISSIGVISGALVQPVQTAKNIGKSIGLARREALNVVPLIPWLNTPMKDQDVEFAADLKQAFEADYLGDVAIAQDLRSELKQQVLDEAYKGAPKIKRATEAVKRGFRDVKDTGSRFSAAGDSVGKMLNWYNRIPQLQKAHPELTPAQVKALALEHAKASMPSYTRSAPLARLISRRAVLVGAFATFNSEMFRTSYNDIERGIEYLRKGARENNTAAAWYGTQQLMMAGMKTAFVGSMWKVAGLSVSAMGALVASIGDDDEEKKAEVQQYKYANDTFRDPEMREALKLVVPDYMRGDVFPIRKVDEDNWTVGTLARFDPMGLNNALVAVQKGADAYAAGYAVIEGLIGPSIIGEDAVKLAGALGTDPDRAKEAAGSMLRSALIPGTVRQVARNFSDTMRNMDEGQARDLLTSIFPLPKNETALTGFEKALGWSGLTATPVNIPEEVVRKLSRLGADVNKQQRKATETLNDTVESDQEFWAQAAVIDATAAEAFKKARAIVDAADKLGYDSNYIVEAADKYSAPLEDGMLYGAIEGKLYLPDLYKTLDGWYDRKVKLVEKDPAKLAQLNERYVRLQKEVTARNKARIAVAKQEGIDAI